MTTLDMISLKAYEFGRFLFDLERGRLMRGEEEIKLRPKSYELLRYLLANQGRVVSKRELISAIWPDSFVTDDSLVQCIGDIRRVLDDGSIEHIKTVPRRGYIFDACVTEIDKGPNQDKPWFPLI